MPNIERAKQIEGWMSEPELIWLAEQAERHRLIVEIGSYQGRSTRALADNTAGVVYAIDDWYGPREFPLDPDKRKALAVKFVQNHADWLLLKVIPVKADHTACEFRDIPTPDMVFIDGGHEYENVCRDIECWKEKLAPGGLLCGHDWDVFPGVNRAVQELLPGAQVAPNTNIWFWEGK